MGQTPYQAPPDTHALPPGAYPSQGPTQSPPRLEPMPPKPEETDVLRPYLTFTVGIFYYEIFGAGYGATIGGHLSPQTVLELDGYRAGALAPTQTSTSVALRLQQIVGKNFYIRGGARYRQLELTRVFETDEYADKLEQSDLGLDIAGGARFDRGNLVLGIDFLGAYVPITSFFTEQQVVDETNGELLLAEEQELRLRWDVRLAYLYLGFRL
jgi:hypothetical protein